MTIKNLITEFKNDKVRISADVYRENDFVGNIYYELEKKFKEFIVEDYSPFFACMLMPAMSRGEDMQVDGKISNKLFKNSKKIKPLLISWGDFKNIEIKASVKNDTRGGESVGSFFSLGVDSFYTHLKNKTNKKNRISHFILVQGFDVTLNNEKLFDEMMSNVIKICKSENKELIVVKTNLREITDKYIKWDWEHGPALASIALLFRKQIKLFYLSGPHAKSQLVPLGLHPDLDYLWSTEYMQIVHDGLEDKRVEKIKKYISKSELALEYLKVCWKNTDGKYNCGKCNKCIRTMVDLYLSNSLERSKTFPKLLSLDMVEKVYAPTPDTICFIKDSIEEAEKNKNNLKLVQALRKSLSISQNPPFKKRMVSFIGYFDRKYNNDRFFHILSKKGLI